MPYDLSSSTAVVQQVFNRDIECIIGRVWVLMTGTFVAQWAVSASKAGCYGAVLLLPIDVL